MICKHDQYIEYNVWIGHEAKEMNLTSWWPGKGTSYDSICTFRTTEIDAEGVWSEEIPVYKRHYVFSSRKVSTC